MSEVCLQAMSQTSFTGCSIALSPGLSANIQPVNIRLIRRSRVISLTSMNEVVLGSSDTGLE